MKIVSGVDKEFAAEVKAKLVVLEVIVIDEIDEVDESNGVDKHRRIVLS